MTDDSKNSFAAQIPLHCCAKSARYTRRNDEGFGAGNVTQNSAILMGHCQFPGNIFVLQI